MPSQNAAGLVAALLLAVSCCAAGQVGYLPTQCTASAAQPVACYEAGAYAGSTWTDLSGNNNSLSVSGSFSFTPIVAGSPSGGGGLFLGGNANAYRSTYSPTLSTTFTFAAWVWATPKSAGNVLFSVARSATNANGELQVWTNSFFDWNSKFGFNPTYAQNVARVPTAGTWQHIALVRSGTTAAWYLNGAPNGVVTGASVTYLGCVRMRCALLLAHFLLGRLRKRNPQPLVFGLLADATPRAAQHQPQPWLRPDVGAYVRLVLHWLLWAGRIAQHRCLCCRCGFPFRTNQPAVYSLAAFPSATFALATTAAASAAAAAFICSVPWLHHGSEWPCLPRACGLVRGDSAEHGVLGCCVVGYACAGCQRWWLGLFNCELLRLERRWLRCRCDWRVVRL